MSLTDRSISSLQKAREFQTKLLSTFTYRKDAILQLIEALACSEKPTSVVELSQEYAFQRTFTNVHRAIEALSKPSEVIGCLLWDLPSTSLNHYDDPSKSVQLELPTSVSPCLFKKQTEKWTRIFSQLIPQEVHRPFKLYVIDATPNARPYAETLSDRTYVHQSGQFGSPITTGLQASLLVAIPEKLEHEAKWVLPLSIERISSLETPCETATRQLIELSQLPENQDVLSVITVDNGYSSLVPQSPNQVVIARSRIDRTGRRLQSSTGSEEIPRRGRPRKYEDFTIQFSESIPQGDEGGPDEEIEHEEIINGREVFVLTSRWNNICIYGRTDLVDIVKVEIFLKDTPQKTLFENPLLLIVSGERKSEVTALQVYESYKSRFDIEHFFRFGKQKLLFCSYQTPELQRQVNWWWICLMTYWLLYLVREIAPESNRPWMPKRRPNITASPGEVKRVFGAKIFPDLGSPSKKPINRGKSKGRSKGARLKKRKRKKIVRKNSNLPKAA